MLVFLVCGVFLLWLVLLFGLVVGCGSMLVCCVCGVLLFFCRVWLMNGGCVWSGFGCCLLSCWLVDVDVELVVVFKNAMGVVDGGL